MRDAWRVSVKAGRFPAFTSSEDASQPSAGYAPMRMPEGSVRLALE